MNDLTNLSRLEPAQVTPRKLACSVGPFGGLPAVLNTRPALVRPSVFSKTWRLLVKAHALGQRRWVKPSQHHTAADASCAEQARYRATAARAISLAADRPDAQFAAKGICRFMIAPREFGWAALKRLGRHLAGIPRLVHTFSSQAASGLDGCGDTGWAGCLRPRKRASGNSYV